MPHTRRVFATAFDEMELEFTENCTATLTKAAHNALKSYFNATIRPLLQDRKIEWEGRAKRFCMAAAAGLGQRISGKIGNGTADEEVVRLAANDLRLYWERTCPLPAVDGTGLEPRKTCPELRAAIAPPPASGTKRKSKRAS